MWRETRGRYALADGSIDSLYQSLPLSAVHYHARTVHYHAHTVHSKNYKTINITTHRSTAYIWPQRKNSRCIVRPQVARYKLQHICKVQKGSTGIYSVPRFCSNWESNIWLKIWSPNLLSPLLRNNDNWNVDHLASKTNIQKVSKRFFYMKTFLLNCGLMKVMVMVMVNLLVTLFSYLMSTSQLQDRSRPFVITLTKLII